MRQKKKIPVVILCVFTTSAGLLQAMGATSVLLLFVRRSNDKDHLA